MSMAGSLDVFQGMAKAGTVGLFQGTVYGLLAVGLVLVYKGTRVFNFAQGEFGTVAAFVAWALLSYAGMPYWAAFGVALIAAVALGLLVEQTVVRPLFDASRITLLVATVGVALLLIGLTVLIAQPEPRVMEPAIAGSGVTVFGAGIGPQQFLVVGVLIAVAVGLAWFFSRTDLGLAVLATSQDSFASRAVGISTPMVSRLIWGLAALLGGLAGLLQAPIGVFTPGFMTATTLVPAFTAAVLGGMTSLPGAFVGGVLIGLARGIGDHLLGVELGVPGSSELTVFLLLMLVLLIRPQGLLGKEA
ncbi:MAG: branched-chain amino acid ABC transporter permease [Micromonosporaceae bacterium]